MVYSSQRVKLAQLFETNRNRDWYFVKPGGNWGDYLIYAGAEVLARQMNLRWTDLDYFSFNPDLIPQGAALYLHGGGGFNPWGSKRAFLNLKRALSTNGTLVIQGPQTADTEASETSALFKDTFHNVGAAEVHIFSREERTHSYLSDSLPDAILKHIDQDTALHLNKANILELSDLRSSPKGRYVLLVARNDDEAPAGILSTIENAVMMDPAYFATSFRHWIRIHAYARRIISNRLHSSIVGTLLEKPVELAAGSYHKNRSIWEYSLKERGVEWKDAPQATTPVNISRSNDSNWPLNSWKLQRLTMRLKGVPLK